ncbi:MAG TPA: cytochrome c [Rubricoccaceae bacterium]|nr:cytochrome c [Rubricoccaceae bacterium]
MSRAALLRSALPFGVLALTLAGCDLLDPFPGPEGLGDPEPEPVTVAYGAQLYVQHCERCHGEKGAGGTIYLDPLWETDEDIEEVIRHGQGAMPAFPQLSDEAVTSLRLYIEDLRRRNGG